MPHIFPRRFLRTRDVLDPTELNDDIHPVYDLTKGRLDRMNYNGPVENLGFGLCAVYLARLL